MSLPDINFKNIRPFDGSRHTGFEEMCSQLASLEPASSGETFHRKGHGGDAGVECYRRRADGTEVGWQAKYLFQWNDSLRRQLDDSIRTALHKHPNLVEYVVCLPFDLSDSRAVRRKTSREKWDAWCAKWKKLAASRKCELTITLWGKSELSTRLSGEDPTYSGRVLYWFDRESLTATWFQEQFVKSRVSLSNRYTLETNVELPIRQDFLAFARTPVLQKQINEWSRGVTEKGSRAVDAIRATDARGGKIYSARLAETIRALRSLVDGDLIGLDQSYPLDDWTSKASNCLNLAGKILHWSYDLPPSKTGSMGVESERWVQHTLHDLMDVLHEIKNALASNRWQLTNARAVLLQGPAGIGKSHLLADIVEHHIHEGRPALLLLGSAFVDNEPWPQIRDQLDLSPTLQFKHFLGSLDAAAQSAGTRALVCIDALNERNGINVWHQRIAAFLKMFEAFPRIGVILSCRSTYVPYVIPDDLDKDRLFRVDHKGFAADGGKAAKIYLDKRGMVRPGAPNLVPEFENPLFLKTCCDSLEKEGKTEFPKGLRGVTSIFAFYNNAVTQSLNRRLKLDPNLEIVPKAITGFSQLLVDTSKGYVSKKAAIALFESVLESGGSLEKSLLAQLESEGLITVEAIRHDDKSVAEVVRFTFERFSDHAIALRLLDKHLNASDVPASFQAGQPLQDFVFGPKSYERAGIIEAMAIQLPQRTGVEILDVGAKASYAVRHAFQESLLWREQSHFTDRTFELVRGLFQTMDEVNDLLVSISTEPSNKFNAFFVHKRLMEMTMPGRDACWSVYLAERGFDGPLETLVSWALQNDLNDVDEDRAYLAATMLTWLLTTSHREVRDKTTKALARVLTQRLLLAARLLGDFVNVNDPYVLERLLAACYGAALQGKRESGLSKLARVVFDTIFANGKPPVNVLLRDHARGIVEYAAWCGVLDSSIDIELAQPPYQSPWPIEPVPDELIECYIEDRGRGAISDKIVYSTAHGGDFARYVVDHKVDKWSPAKIGTRPLPTSLDICKIWMLEFFSIATEDQREAFNEFVNATKGIKDVHGHQSTPETERLDAAEAALQETMTSDQWEDFRVRARDLIRRGLSTGYSRDQPAHFDVLWGRRWICKRAHELGWTSERFGNFDDYYHSFDRHKHRVERIGKKYQWLALYELMARMADNLAFLGSPVQEDAEPHQEQIASEVGLRDIDPSLLTTETHYDGWGEWGRTWWVPVDPKFRSISPRERLAWLESENDIVNESTLIDLRNPKTGRKWLALWGFSKWKGYGVLGEKNELQRDTWFRLTCIVVHSKDQAKMIKSLREKTLTHPDSFPEIELNSWNSYLGEYHWHSEIGEFEDWISRQGWRTFTVPIRPTVASYICEKGNYDCSIDKTISVNMPAPWLCNEMSCRLSSGRSLVFRNSEGRDIFYDPSVVEPGPAAALVDRDAFLQMLDLRNLSAIWIIAGEKNAYGGREVGSGFGGCLQHTAIYSVDGDCFRRHIHKGRVHPTSNQLEEFFGDDPVPSGIVTREMSRKPPISGARLYFNEIR